MQSGIVQEGILVPVSGVWNEYGAGRAALENAADGVDFLKPFTTKGTKVHEGFCCFWY